MKTHDEVLRIYESLRGKQETLAVSVTNLTEILHLKRVKQREVNIRLNKLEKYLSRHKKKDEVKEAQLFQSMAKFVLPTKLYNDILTEATATANDNN